MEGLDQTISFKPLPFIRFSDLKLKVSANKGHPTLIVEFGGEKSRVEENKFQ